MLRLFLFRLSESFFRHRYLYLLPVLIMLGCGVAYFLLAKTKYQAQGVLFIRRDSFLSQLTEIPTSSGSIWTTPAKETSDEINEMMQTDAFVRAIIQNTPLEEKMAGTPKEVDKVIDQVRNNAWAAPIGDNQISINTISEDPDTAVKLSDGIIYNYLQWKENAQRSESQTALVFFNQVLQEYQAQLDQALAAKRSYLLRHPEPLKGNRSETEVMEIDQLQMAIDMASERLSRALDKEEDARLAVSQVESNTRHTYMVIDTPRIPQKGITSRREKAIQSSIFVAIGILLSGAALVGTMLTDRSFYLPGDVRQKLNLPVLATIPDLTQGKRRPRESLKAPAKGEISLPESKETEPRQANDGMPSSSNRHPGIAAAGKSD
jgi:hypothetical protein